MLHLTRSRSRRRLLYLLILLGFFISSATSLKCWYCKKPDCKDGLGVKENCTIQNIHYPRTLAEPDPDPDSEEDAEGDEDMFPDANAPSYGRALIDMNYPGEVVCFKSVFKHSGIITKYCARNIHNHTMGCRLRTRKDNRVEEVCICRESLCNRAPMTTLSSNYLWVVGFHMWTVTLCYMQFNNRLLS